ncbi:MAG TPA: BON domain-containing protein, partial [Woeseiaceae bacterium]
MAREDERRRGPERGWRRERGRWSSESARRSVRGDDASGTEYADEEYGPPRTWRSQRVEGRRFRPDERGRDGHYGASGRRDDTGYGNEWPEDYHSDFSGQLPERDRDAYSERQSGPYRSPVSGRPVSEEQYRDEAHWHRSRPYTGFSGRVSEFGYEDPTWAVPQMGRTGGAAERRFPPPGTGFRGVGPRNYTRSDERIREDVCDQLSEDGEVDASNIDIEVEQGRVVLSGTVPERYMKHRAEDIADGCRGVQDVENRIRIERPQ